MNPLMDVWIGHWAKLDQKTSRENHHATVAEGAGRVRDNPCYSFPFHSLPFDGCWPEGNFSTCECIESFIYSFLNICVSSLSSPRLCSFICFESSVFLLLSFSASLFIPTYVSE